MNILTDFLRSNQTIEGTLPFLLDELTFDFISQNFTKASAEEVLDNNLVSMKDTNYKKTNNHIFINLNNEIYKYNN